MRLISIDIGIKNLAVIILEVVDNNDIKILNWNILNLCNFIPNCSSCKKPAKYTKDNSYFCKQHTKHSKYKLPEIEFKNLAKHNMKTLTEYAEKMNIEYDKTGNKIELVKVIEDYKNNYCLEKIETVNSNNINLIDIGINLKIELNKLFTNIDINDIDTVIIENQISPIANRMKTLQGMVAQYFINNNINNIEFISSVNKLKLFTNKLDKTDKHITYAERKKLGISYTTNFLIDKKMHNELEFFNKHIKRDDLADCLLQGIYYLHKLDKIII